jgi:hypothetical protein
MNVYMCLHMLKCQQQRFMVALHLRAGQLFAEMKARLLAKWEQLTWVNARNSLRQVKNLGMKDVLQIVVDNMGDAGVY